MGLDVYVLLLSKDRSASFSLINLLAVIPLSVKSPDLGKQNLERAKFWTSEPRESSCAILTSH